ncbi:MAG: hypothetical protein ACOC9J_00995 [Persicimonas sp.]
MSLSGASVASAQSVEEREADMFGEPADDEPVDEGEPTEQDAEQEEEDEPIDEAATTLLEEQMERRLAERDEATLDIGGGLFSQLQYSVLEEGSPETFPLSQPNILDVYLDARPNDRLRVFAEGRVTHTPTGTSELLSPISREVEPTQVALDELWLKFDVDRTVYVTAGRQHLRWGVGRFWYPNDFLFEQRRDPLAIFDVRTGADIIKAHFPLESLGWNFYAVVNLQEAGSPQDVGGAARAEFLAGLTEFALSAAAKKDDPLQLGLDVSTGLGWFDVRAALTLLHDVDTPFFRGESNFQDFDEIALDNLNELEIPEAFSREGDWIPRALVGAEVGLPYGDDDTLYLGAEYFFNDAGYSDPEIYPWLIFNGAFRPLYTGRHYASVYALLPSPGRFDDSSFSLATLGNLSDRSFLSRLDYSVTVLTHLRAFAFGSFSWGADGEFTQGFRVPAISEDVLQLAEAGGEFEAPQGMDLDDGFGGFSFPATRANLGVGIRLSY